MVILSCQTKINRTADTIFFPVFAESLNKIVEAQGFKVIDIIVVLDHLIEYVEKYVLDGIHLEGVIISTDLARIQI